MLYDPLQFDFELIRDRRVYKIIGTGKRQNDDLSVCYENVILILDQFYLIISINNDTDEIVLSIIDENKMQNCDILEHEPLEILHEFYGNELGWCWIGRNYVGYADTFMLSFSGIVPQIMMHGMASMLDIYKINKA